MSHNLPREAAPGANYAMVTDADGKSLVWALLSAGDAIRLYHTYTVGNEAAGDTVNEVDYLETGSGDAIGNAIAQITADGNGGSIFIRRGDYEIASNITIPPNVSIFGENPNITVPAGVAITISDGGSDPETNVTISGLRLTITATSGFSIVADGNILFENLYITGPGTPFQLSGTWGEQIAIPNKGITIRDCRFTGITSLLSEAVTGSIAYINILNCRGTFTDNIMHLSSITVTNSIMIGNCQFSMIAGGTPAKFFSFTGNVIEGIYFIDSLFFSASGFDTQGLLAVTATQPTHIVLRGIRSSLAIADTIFMIDIEDSMQNLYISECALTEPQNLGGAGLIRLNLDSPSGGSNYYKGYNVHILNNRLTTRTANSVVIRVPDATGVHIEGNHIGMGDASNQKGVHITTGNNSRIKSNVFNPETGTTGSQCVDIDGGNHHNIEGNTFRSTTLATAGNWVAVNLSGDNQHCRIVNNQAIGGGNNSLFVLASTNVADANIQFVNNYIENWTNGGTATRRVVMLDADGALIANNIFQDITGSVIGLSAACNRLSILGNRAETLVQFIATPLAILDSIISGNHIHGNTGTAIEASIGNSIISDNIIGATGAPSADIDLLASADTAGNHIVNNRLTSTATASINIQAGNDNNHILNNKITTATADAGAGTVESGSW